MNTLREFSDAIDGRLLPDSAARDAAAVLLGSIVIDSRKVEPGDVFWALTGPNHDGANFVGEAEALAVHHLSSWPTFDGSAPHGSFLSIEYSAWTWNSSSSCSRISCPWCITASTASSFTDT